LYRRVFPRCRVAGPIDPVPFTFNFSTGSMPRKCLECELWFECECVRGRGTAQPYRSFDHGPCETVGSSEPVWICSTFLKPVPVRGLHVVCCEYLDREPVDPQVVERENPGWTFYRRLFAPRKCTTCEYLTFNRFNQYVCTFQQEVWGDFHRALDWGHHLVKMGSASGSDGLSLRKA